MKTKIGLIAYMWMIFSGIEVFAQSPFAIHLTTKNGLPSNKVYCAYQDVNGLMWFGTDNGLVRYSGSEIKTFSVKDGLPDNDIFSVFEDLDHRLWVIGFKQAPCYFYNNKLFTTANDTFLERYFKNKDMFGFAVNQGLKRIIFYVLYKDSNYMVEYGKLIPLPVSSATFISKGIASRLFNTNKSDYLVSGTLVYNITNKTSFIGKSYEPISEADQINVNGESIGIALTGKRNKILFFKIQSDTINCIKTIFKDSIVGMYNNVEGEVLVICTNGTLYVLNKNSLELELVNYSVTNSRISTGFIDDKKSKWICTHDDGLFILPKESAEILTANNEKGATCIVYNSDNQSMNVGFENNTIHNYGKGNISQRINLAKNRTYSRITGMVYYGGNIYIAGDTKLGVYHIAKKEYENLKGINSRTLSSIKDLELSPRNKLLVGSANGASIISFDNTIEEVWQIRTTAIQEAINGDLYLGTINGLYLRKQGINEVTIKQTFTGLDGARITDIKIDKSGCVWVGTAQYGLFILYKDKILNISDEKMSECTITSYYVKNIFIDNNNVAWISTDKGLNRIEYSAVSGRCTVERVTSSFTIPDENINSSVVIGDTIYMASLSGVYRMHYSKSRLNEKPGIQILSTYVNSAILDIDKMLILKPSENNISINFVAIAFRNPESIEFRYRLMGADAQWIRSKNGHVDLLSLTSGEYRFEVQAINLLSDERSEVKFIEFKIAKPWFKQYWFLGLCVLILVLIVRFIILRRTKIIRNKLEENRKVSKQVAELEMQALRAQMNPHFIFNALSAIQNYFVTNNEERANSYMAKFSRLIRQMLEYSKNNFISLDEEIALVKNYMELECMRFENKLEFQLHIEEQIDTTEYKLPSLLLQPILENAVNHGIRPSETSGIIKLTISSDTESLYCTIADNGIGILKANEDRMNNSMNHNSRGIEILSKRIESLNQLYNCKISFQISDLSQHEDIMHGTEVVLKFPIELVSESILKLQ